MSQLRGRVLILDDNEIWLEIFSDILTDVGLDVVAVQTYSEAVNLLNKQRFDLAIIDVRLEGDSVENTQGLDIIDYIDQIGLDDVVAKIIVTGIDTNELRRLAFKRYGGYAFIRKQGSDGSGFDGEDFVRIVRMALAEKVKSRSHTANDNLQQR